jgi:hypothetical protein
VSGWCFLLGGLCTLPLALFWTAALATAQGRIWTMAALLAIIVSMALAILASIAAFTWKRGIGVWLGAIFVITIGIFSLPALAYGMAAFFIRGGLAAIVGFVGILAIAGHEEEEPSLVPAAVTNGAPQMVGAAADQSQAQDNDGK